MIRLRKIKVGIDPQGAPPEASRKGKSAEERVRDAIIEAVLSHRLPPGTRLIESKLCKAFCVNRSLLRRVFVRLAGDKIIEHQHNKGVIIAQPHPEEMRKVLEARLLIESGIIRALGNKAAQESLAVVRTLVRREQAAYQSGNWSEWVRLSGEYHLQIAQLLGNAELVDILRSLIARTTLTFALYYSLGNNVCSFDEHNNILNAMEGGDSEYACKLMEAHLHDVEVKLPRDSTEPKVDLVTLFTPPASGARQSHGRTAVTRSAGWMNPQDEEIP